MVSPVGQAELCTSPCMAPPRWLSVKEAQELLQHKAAAKLRVQESLGLEVDAQSVLISFVGRWAFEKGVDLVAEAVH